jgi:hypothetical protein
MNLTGSNEARTTISSQPWWLAKIKWSLGKGLESKISIEKHFRASLQINCMNFGLLNTNEPGTAIKVTRKNRNPLIIICI